MAREYGWLSLAVLVGVLTAANVIASAVAVLRGDLLGLLRVSVSLLFGYWMVVGAWRRTRWGLFTVDAADVGSALNATHTRRLVFLAAACCMLLTLSLAVQVVVARG